MGYLNVPANGWPQLRDLEKLDKIAQQMGDLPTFTSDDRAFLEAVPAMPTEKGKTVLTANTDNQGNTELTYETPEVEGSDIAPTFLESVTYSAGTMVYYEGVLYKYTADHTAGAWDPSEVTPTSAAAEFVETNAAVNELKNTLTSTEERLNSNIFGSPVNILSYTSANKYTFPADGYVQIRSEQAGSYITARINGIAWISRQKASDYQLLYVKKGMTFYVYSMDGNAEAYFCPLQSS